jgi:hypothetical protein
MTWEWVALIASGLCFVTGLVAIEAWKQVGFAKALAEEKFGKIDFTGRGL